MGHTALAVWSSTNFALLSTKFLFFNYAPHISEGLTEAGIQDDGTFSCEALFFRFQKIIFQNRFLIENLRFSI
uniref:Uncharacterized protein n=1 Tax=Rhizoctonia solani TaxID=456999 RepID=N0A5E6_9AGAM|nr:hypothetical protein RSOL_m01650 [Rhizoctonia solani]AGK45473.1 hypothetical protein RSOL_m01650 [Rhizoctonia solani]